MKMNGPRLHPGWPSSRRTFPLLAGSLALTDAPAPTGAHPRVVIVGSSSIGKTWLANTLGAIAAVPVMHEPQAGRAPAKGWIVDTSFAELGAAVLKRAQALVWLHLEAPAAPACPNQLELDLHTHVGLEKLLTWALSYRLQGESFTSHLSLFRRFAGCRLCIQTEEEAVSLVDSAMQVGVSAALAAAAGPLHRPRWR
jgi:hypothetical protein